MPHEEAMLAEALAELALLSRRVAELTATVSALSASHGPRPPEQTPAEGPSGAAPLEPPAWLPSPFPPSGFAPPPHWPGWSFWLQPPPSSPPLHPATVAAEQPLPSLPAARQGSCPRSTGDPQASDALVVETPRAADVVVTPSPAASPTNQRSPTERSAATADVTASRSSPSGDEQPRGLSKRRAKPQPKRRRRRLASPQKPSKPHRGQQATPADRGLAARERSTPPRQRRRLGPLAISSSVHGLVLVILATVFVVRDQEPEPLVINSSLSPLPPLEAVSEIEIAPPTPLEPPLEQPPELLAPDLADLEPLGPPLDDLAPAGELPQVETVSLVDVGLMTGPSAADLQAPVGAAAEGQGGGGSQTAGAAHNRSLFFGTVGGGSSICYLCDNSRSYEDGGFETVVGELLRSVASLSPEQSFFVVFFSDEAYPMFFPDVVDELMPATAENKQRLQLWLSGVETRTGGQGLRDAVALVETLQPASVCLLSDGDHSASLIERLISADLGETVVNTFGMQNLPSHGRGLTPERLRKQQQHNQNLIDVAIAHGGVFTPVVVHP